MGRIRIKPKNSTQNKLRSLLLNEYGNGDVEITVAPGRKYRYNKPKYKETYWYKKNVSNGSFAFLYPFMQARGNMQCMEIAANSVMQAFGNDALMEYLPVVIMRNKKSRTPFMVDTEIIESPDQVRKMFLMTRIVLFESLRAVAFSYYELDYNIEECPVLAAMGPREGFCLSEEDIYMLDESGVIEGEKDPDLFAVKALHLLENLQEKESDRTALVHCYQIALISACEKLMREVHYDLNTGEEEALLAEFSKRLEDEKTCCDFFFDLVECFVSRASMVILNCSLKVFGQTLIELKKAVDKSQKEGIELKADYEEKIADFRKKNRELTEQLNKEEKEEVDASKLQKKAEMLSRKLESAQAEIDALKDQIRMDEEVEIEAIKEEAEKKHRLDPSLRYAVANQDSNFEKYVDDMRRYLPNIKAFSKASELSTDNVDMVLILTRHINHSFYWALKAKCKSANTPFLHISCKNEKQVLSTIEEWAERNNEDEKT